ncbi:IPT/TIG domain-containing protein [Rufibacter roseus]
MTTAPKAGWTHSGLATTDASINLGSTDGGNGSTTRSATFNNAGATLTIDFSGITTQKPGELSFQMAYTGTNSTYDGALVLQEFVEGSWNTIRTFNSTNPVAKATSSTGPSTSITQTLSSTATQVRFVSNAVPAGGATLVDKVILNPLADSPEINVVKDGTNQANNSTYTFPQQNRNTTSAPATFTIQNTGAADLTVSSITLGGSNPDQFEITQQPTSPVAGSGSTTFSVVFKPTGSGLSRSATLNFVTNDTDETNYTINLAGTTTTLAPVIDNFSPTSGSYGDLITINGSNLINTEVVYFANSVAAPFTIVNDNQITATVPEGAITGKIQVVNNNGTAVANSPSDFTVIAPAPVISSFTPTSGPVGTVVTVTGSYFSEGGGLLFYDESGQYVYADNYQFISSTEVRGQVPASAVTGPIAVENDVDITDSGTNFTVTVPAPTITSLTPDAGPVGTEVTVAGTNFANTQSVTFNGVAAIDFTVAPDGNSLVVIVPAGATPGPLAVTTPGGTAQANFTVTGLTPVISSFTPTSGPVGTVVTVTGAYFTADGGLLFYDESGQYVYADNYQFISSTEVRGQVPASAVTGPIAVENDVDITDSGTNFTVTVPAPTITSLTPDAGPVGTEVTVAGTNFANTQSVTFNGVAATDFTVAPDGNSLVVVVPAGATTGPLVVNTPGGTAQANFTVTGPAPVISTVTPTRAPVGTEVTVTGSNFSTAANNGNVIFTDPAGNPVIADNYRIENGSILFNVPANAVSGSFIVQNQYGNTSTPFTVTTPIVTTFNPTRAPIGTEIIVKGANFVSAEEGGRMQFYNNSNQLIDAENYQFVNPNEIKGTVPSEAAPSGQITITGADGQVTASSSNFEVGTLPVELVDFTASPSERGVTLSWETASERDNAYFEVQSTTDLKGGQFKALGQVDSKATNSSVATAYKFEDASPAGGQTYYRLKQVDLNGSYEYSKVIVIERGTVHKASTTVIPFPNPVLSKLNLNVETQKAGQLKVSVYRTTGNKVFEQVFFVETGRTSVEIQEEQLSLSPGVYILTTQMHGKTTHHRIVK